MTTDKCVLFLGASNTFGVGLHVFRDIYMSELGANTLVWPYNQLREDNKFIYKNRWTAKVSGYLNRKEINVGEAGGSPAESLHILENRDLTNIDYIFFEFSGIYSYFDKYFHNAHSPAHIRYPRTPHEIETFLTNGKNDRPELRERITNWLVNYDAKEFIDEVFVTLKNKIETLHEKKFIILFWNECEINLEDNKYRWLKDYTVQFPTEDNKNNYVVQNLLNEKKLRVMDEYPFFHILQTKYPKIIDIHAGLVGNKLIANIIINYLDEKKLVNSR